MKTERFASKTSVTVERSQTELMGILRKHGVSKMAVLHEPGVAAVGFEAEGLRVRLEMSVPDSSSFWPGSPEEYPHGWKSWNKNKREGWCEAQSEQAARQRWRALVLVTKAKFEIIAEGISTVQREFMADTILPNGQRVEQWLVPQMNKVLNGKMPPLLKA